MLHMAFLSILGSEHR